MTSANSTIKHKLRYMFHVSSLTLSNLPRQKTPSASHIYSFLSPRTKKKVQLHWQLIDQLVYKKSSVRSQGSTFISWSNSKSTLCQKIKYFFHHPDMVKICSDTKKVAVHPNEWNNSKTMLCQKIGEIFYHSDVANICPDKKKVNVD